MHLALAFLHRNSSPFGLIGLVFQSCMCLSINAYVSWPFLVLGCSCLVLHRIQYDTPNKIWAGLYCRRSHDVHKHKLAAHRRSGSQVLWILPRLNDHARILGPNVLEHRLQPRKLLLNRLQIAPAHQHHTTDVGAPRPGT